MGWYRLGGIMIFVIDGGDQSGQVRGAAANENTTIRQKV